MLKLIVQTSRAILGVPYARRCFLFGLVTLDLLQVTLGATLLNVFLMERPLLFAIYWLVCGWITLGMGLLALYDIVCVLSHAREERRGLVDGEH